MASIERKFALIKQFNSNILQILIIARVLLYLKSYILMSDIRIIKNRQSPYVELCLADLLLILYKY